MGKIDNLAVVILAAGMGKRLGGRHQKTVIEIFGKPILKYLLDTVKKINPSKIIVVVGFKKEEVLAQLEGEKVEYVEQKKLRGTGDAVLTTEKLLKDFEGNILVLNGDTPFLSKETIENLISIHKKNGSICTFLTSILENPKGYGRVIRDKNGEVLRIVEEVNADEEEKKIREVNAGVYIFNSNHLFPALKKIKPDTVKNEVYLTEIIRIFKSKNKKISTYTTPDPEETIGINTPEDLEKAKDYLRRRKIWIAA